MSDIYNCSGQAPALLAVRRATMGSEGFSAQCHLQIPWMDRRADVQNCSKNIIIRFVMIGRPDFSQSAAAMGSEFVKLLSLFCPLYYCAVSGQIFGP